MTRRAIPCLAIALALASSGKAQAQSVFVTPPIAVEAPDTAVNPRPGDARPVLAQPAGGPPTERRNVGNPLWAIPLRVLTVTRDRPIFAPSRRAPPPVVTKAPEPSRPQLSLVGTVFNESEGIGIFLDPSTRNIVRLRTGEGHGGWILRTVRGREATLQKDSATVILALPPPAGGTDQVSEPQL